LKRRIWRGKTNLERKKEELLKESSGIDVKIKSLKDKIEELDAEIVKAAEKGDYEREAQLKIEKVNLEKELKTLESQKMQEMIVTWDDVARVVSEWTGIPLSRIERGRKRKAPTS